MLASLALALLPRSRDLGVPFVRPHQKNNSQGDRIGRTECQKRDNSNFDDEKTRAFDHWIERCELVENNGSEYDNRFKSFD
jgi:hypothetical protein